MANAAFLALALVKWYREIAALPKAGLMRIALIGTRGVPARYGGFETAVEEVGRRLVARGMT